MATSWLTVTVDRAALSGNMQAFRSLVGADTRLMAVVKADAYGHGLLIAARAFLEGGADVLGVHSLGELRGLRDGGIGAPVLVLGPLAAHEVAAAAELGAEITVGSVAALHEAAAADVPCRLHLKVETGVNRQGIVEDELEICLGVLAGAEQCRLVGLSSHFADVEDTTDHAFAQAQMDRFAAWRQALADAGHGALTSHMSCSAAVLVWDRTHGDLARVGVAGYGVWPSRETRVALRQRGREELRLQPALTWSVRVSQVRHVPRGETVGYGRTWKAMTDSRVAVLPVGYADGLPRRLGDRGHVLLHGRRAPLVGRVCMNLCMVDVTNVPQAAAGDEAVLLGRQGEEIITAEMLADQLGTIAYEVLTLPGDTWTRREA